MAQVKQFIEQEITGTGVSPSYAEIMLEFGFCDEAAVCRVVQNLERYGFVRREGSGRQRRIRLVVNQ